MAFSLPDADSFLQLQVLLRQGVTPVVLSSREGQVLVRALLLDYIESVLSLQYTHATEKTPRWRIQPPRNGELEHHCVGDHLLLREACTQSNTHPTVWIPMRARHNDRAVEWSDNKKYNDT